MRDKSLKRMMANNHAKAKKMIDDFCATPSFSDGGSWSPVGERDIHQLYAIVEAIIQAKYGPDASNDLPINFDCVDRTRFAPLHYQPVPYIHKVPLDETGDKARLEILDTLMYNLRNATSALGDFMKLNRLGESQGQKPVPLLKRSLKKPKRK
jgi:hypothetical protein